jgi:hypothetical protein
MSIKRKFIIIALTLSMIIFGIIFTILNSTPKKAESVTIKSDEPTIEAYKKGIEEFNNRKVTGGYDPSKTQTPEMVTPPIHLVNQEQKFIVHTNVNKSNFFTIDKNLGQLGASLYYGESKNTPIPIDTTQSRLSNISWLDNDNISVTIKRLELKDGKEDLFDNPVTYNDITNIGVYIINLKTQLITKIYTPIPKGKGYYSFAVDNQSGTKKILICDLQKLDLYSSKGSFERTLYSVKSGEKINSMYYPSINDKGQVELTGQFTDPNSTLGNYKKIVAF